MGCGSSSGIDENTKKKKKPEDKLTWEKAENTRMVEMFTTADLDELEAKLNDGKYFNLFISPPNDDKDFSDD